MIKSLDDPAAPGAPRPPAPAAYRIEDDAGPDGGMLRFVYAVAENHQRSELAKAEFERAKEAARLETERQRLANDAERARASAANDAAQMRYNAQVTHVLAVAFVVVVLAAFLLDKEALLTPLLTAVVGLGSGYVAGVQAGMRRAAQAGAGAPHSPPERA